VSAVDLTLSKAPPHVWAIWVILAAQLMLQMDFLIVLVALPQIQGDLGFTAAGLSWVPNAFALAFGGLLLLGGRLGDMIGQVRAFRIGLIIFTLASLFGGIATSAIVLIAARVLQGVGAALAGPSVLALIAVMSRSDAERQRGLSMFIAVSAIGSSAGLLLGGVLTELLSWRWSLLINVPVGALLICSIGRLVPETRPQRTPLDLGGAVTATLGSALLVYGFIQAADKGWATYGTGLSLACAAALLFAFFRLESSHRAPLLDLNLLRNRPRLAALGVMAAVVGMHFSLLFLLVQYLQRVLGFDSMFAGLAYIPLTATVFVMSHFAPRLIAAFGPRVLLVTGSVLVSLSLVGFALLDENSSYFPAVLIPLLIHAAGIALVFAPGTVTIMDGVPDENAGAASGLLQMDQQIGGAVGVAIIAAIYATAADAAHFETGLPLAFAAAAILTLFAAVLAWFGVRRRIMTKGSVNPAAHL
jgi:EmrB/QacA subfamily drug resistance transporter